MKTIVKMIHGSKLYGLDGPDSDFDEKAIHLPTLEDCLLMKATKNIQVKDVENNREMESFSLQTFLENAANGEAFAIDMLHSGMYHWMEYSSVWTQLWANRDMFYTKRLSGSLRYSKNMASKYALKAERMVAVGKVLTSLNIMAAKGVGKLYQAWDDLPNCEFTERGIDENNKNADKRYYEICGKKIQPTIAVSYAQEIVQRLYDSFGARVAAVAHLDQKELKSISHAFRVGYQLLHIYLDGNYSYPLPENQFLRDLKFAKLNYVDDKIEQKLDDLLADVERLSAQSEFPEKVDDRFLRKIVLDAYDLTQD